MKLAAACAAWCALTGATLPLARADSGTPAPAAIQQYCRGCHSGASPAGGLALDQAAAADPVGRHPEIWEKVVRRLHARSMPPAGLPRPNEAGYTALLGTLETALDRAAAANPDPGRTTTFRRLNRTEYQNAVRDLLAVEVDVTSLLPADDVSHGFDNITVAALSPTLLERYLAAARRISRLAVGIPPRTPGGETITLPADLTQEERLSGLPPGTRGGAAVEHLFPVTAEYEIVLRLARDRNEHVEGLTGVQPVEIALDGRRLALLEVRPPPPGEDHQRVDAGLKIRVPVPAGPHTVTALFPKTSSALPETERQPYQAHFNMDRHPRIHPALYSVSINGPFGAALPGDSPSRQRLFVCRPASPAGEEPCASRILTGVLRRAYRRPVTSADLAAPLDFYRRTRPAEGFDAGIEMALRAILVSPEFLFHIELDPPAASPGAVYRVSDLELASRLSFLFWSSIPDDALLDLAAAGRLRDPAVLSAQIRRLAADPRAASLTRNFAAQWLFLRNLASITPDMRAFPDFDDNLRQSFRQETELFLASLFTEDRPLTELLTANYTFLNERLARHYGIPNVAGSRFRRVEFAPGAARGGLLRQGSILTVTSYATRTSPVVRGKWILDNLLGAPPPPPPPAVPALAETHDTPTRAATMRERLASHRDKPACRGCHQLMDPIGFTLENYDAIGRWRDREGGAPVDASGGLPGGGTFTGVDGLNRALLTHPELLASTFTEKLLTYALGRGLTPADAPAIRQIVRDAARRDYRLSAFLSGVVTSLPFQYRRTP